MASLPSDLERNFKLMRELDSRSSELVEEIDELQKQYHPEARKAYEASKQPDKDKVEKILSHLKSCLKYSDEKVDIAMQTYELVDKHIRRLDDDLARFEAELEVPIVHGASANRKRKPQSRSQNSSRANKRQKSSATSEKRRR